MRELVHTLEHPSLLPRPNFSVIRWVTCRKLALTHSSVFAVTANADGLPLPRKQAVGHLRMHLSVHIARRCIACKRRCSAWRQYAELKLVARHQAAFYQSCSGA
jgi:hypothetical protein